MKTITFYSYKGGTGRSLAVANAARYLARLGFKVVALDFDLEAPGLHYKFSTNPDGTPLAVEAGVVDYLSSFVFDGQVSRPLKEFALDVSVPGTDKPVKLIPAGRVPSSDYWSKLSRINWHELFYPKGAKGVQVFLELKNRILDELEPDFLLVDSRTGITEMGGVATTLFADRVICFVLPPMENLEGARAVLRSLKRTRRESETGDLEIMVALSRLPGMKGEDEGEIADRIRSVMNEEAEDLKDTLSCREVFVLHSEAALQVREALRVGSGVSPDESILLRDYLRLFASVVPWELIEPQLHHLLQRAKEKIWVDPDAAVKEVEELAESYGRPEIYRDLLRFYQVRNVGGTLVLKRAQRLWELTGNPRDPALWDAVNGGFQPEPRGERESEWSPNLDFIRAVWHDAGNKDPEFGMKLAHAYQLEDHGSLGADVLLEVIKSSEPTLRVVLRCIDLLEGSKRSDEADALIQQVKGKLGSQPEFVEVWARRALGRRSKDALSELSQPPLIDQLRHVSASLAAQVYLRSGLRAEAMAILNSAMRDVLERRVSEDTLFELAQLFREAGRWDEFDKAVGERYPDRIVDELRDRFGIRRRFRR
jgi:MinD-like ATPase involved in chromosome partitioning or flagellar assembly